MERRLLDDIESLRQQGYLIEPVPDGQFTAVVFRDVQLPPGYNKQTADLLIRVPPGYPDAAPDMFWTSPDLLRADGSVPQMADVMEAYVDRTWRRFSWHRARWAPNVDWLGSQLEFAVERLSRL